MCNESKRSDFIIGFELEISGASEPKETFKVYCSNIEVMAKSIKIFEH